MMHSQRLFRKPNGRRRAAPGGWGRCLWLVGLVGMSGVGSPVLGVTQPLELSNVAAPRAIAPTPLPRTADEAAHYLPLPSQQISLLVLDLSERQLHGYQGDRHIATYPVAVGRDEWETPTGQFTVFQKQQHPAWEHPLTGEIVAPGPENPLGARWLGFWTDGLNSIGFHGTPDEQLIGQAVSHGCVRMRNADVIELYDRVRLGARVIVQP